MRAPRAVLDSAEPTSGTGDRRGPQDAAVRRLRRYPAEEADATWPGSGVPHAGQPTEAPAPPPEAPPARRRAGVDGAHPVPAIRPAARGPPGLQERRGRPREGPRAHDHRRGRQRRVLPLRRTANPHPGAFARTPARTARALHAELKTIQGADAPHRSGQPEAHEPEGPSDPDDGKRHRQERRRRRNRGLRRAERDTKRQGHEHDAWHERPGEGRTQPRPSVLPPRKAEGGAQTRLATDRCPTGWCRRRTRAGVALGAATR